MSFIRPHGWGVGVPPQGWIDKEHLLPGVLENLQPAWWYNWSPFRYLPDVAPGYVPMLWSGREASVNNEQFKATLAERPYRIWQFLNEPNRKGQADISPELAFEGLQAFLALTRETGVTGQYGAPGVEMTESGLSWAAKFFKLCRQHFIHRPAYVTVHCYLIGQAQTRSNWDAMWATFWEWHAIWTPAVPVVVSEVCAVNHPEDKQRVIMDLAREKLATDPRVVGVAWFAANDFPGGIFPNGSLSTYDAASESVSLTPLGEYWKSLR